MRIQCKSMAYPIQKNASILQYSFDRFRLDNSKNCVFIQQFFTLYQSVQNQSYLVVNIHFHICALMQNRCNSSANALELRIFCINP